MRIVKIIYLKYSIYGICSSDFYRTLGLIKKLKKLHDFYTSIFKKLFNWKDNPDMEKKGFEFHHKPEGEAL